MTTREYLEKLLGLDGRTDTAEAVGAADRIEKLCADRAKTPGLLAVALVTHCLRRGLSAAGLDRSGLENWLEPARALHRLLVLVGAAFGHDEATLAKSGKRVRETLARVEEFESSVLPRNLRQIGHEALKARVGVWVERRDWPESEVRAHATGKLRDAVGPAAGDIGGFADRIPVARLRTYTDAEFARVAKNWVEWGPLIVWLGRPDREEDPGREAHEAKLAELEGKLRRFLAGNKYVKSEDLDDAVQTGLTVALQQEFDPEHGYTFEGPYPNWLGAKSTAVGRRKWERQVETLEPRSRPDAGPAGKADRLHAALQWMCHLWFGLLFIRDDTVPKVKYIERLGALFRDEITDEELATLLSIELDDSVTANNVRVLRHRARQRDLVIKYVLYEHESGPKARAPELAALDHLRQGQGCNERDVPMLAKVANLAAVSRSDLDPELLWASFAVRLLKAGGSLKAATEALTRQWDLVKRAKKLEPSLRTTRLDRARRWWELHSEGLSPLRGWVRERKADRLFAAVWHLQVLLEHGPQGAEAVLGPRPEEEGGLMADLGSRIDEKGEQPC